MELHRLVGDRYELGEVLGYGGMSTVFAGVDTYTGQTVALKQLDSQLVTSHLDAIQRFEREAEALRSLNHPNIIKVLATFTEPGDIPGAHVRYIVMEYASGGTLSDLLDQKRRLELRSFLEISLDLVDALTRAHRLKIIHRDIKPANVMLAGDGTPRLTDFGVARIGDAGKEHSSRLTQAGMMLGTIDYLSPEACKGEELDARTDIWSLGVMLFEMLAGQRPFSGANAVATITAILNQPVPDIEALRPDLPAALGDLIYRMLEKDREARIPSVRIVGAELERLMSDVDEDGLSAAQPLVPAAPRFDTPTPQPANVPRSNMPEQITRFVGREAELEELTGLLSESHIRLVTILGPGGIGKTRLAQEAAAIQLNNYAHGITFVPLAPLESANDIIPAVAEASGYQFYEGGQPDEQLLDFFQQKQMLLLIDNCEHLLDGIGFVGRLLSCAPKVRVLATSREKLNLQEEICVRLEGMGVPEEEIGGDGFTPEDIDKYSAIKLFLQSARRARPGYEITDGDLPSIVHICRQVSGSPLAIMLAAAWVELLSPAEIAGEIEQNIDFLVTELRDVPARQRSIRAVFASSWSQLSEAERKTFMALSIFRGGFSREAAEAVASADLRSLLGFVNKSLLRRDPKSARYEIHELLRQYAGERLEAEHMTKQVRNLHSTYYIQFMEKRLQGMLGPGQVKVLDEIEAEFENVRKAWIWAVDQKEFSAVGNALESLFVFSDMRSREYEGEELLRLAREGLAPGQGEEPHPVWGRLLLPWFDILLQSKGRPDNDEALMAQANTGLKLAEAHGDKVWTAYSLIMLGHFVEADEAIKMYERALALVPRLDDSFWVRIRMGYCFRALGDHEEEIKAFKRSYLRGREIGESEKMGYGLFNLGETEMFLGDHDSARTHFQEAKIHLRQVGTSWGIILTNVNLSLMMLWKGELNQAGSLIEEAHEIAKESNRSNRIEKGYLTVLGYLALIGQDYPNAKHFFEEILSEYTVSPEASLGLVFIAGESDDHAAARQYLQDALRPPAPYRVPAMVILCLPAAALISRDEEGTERAVELLALAFSHPQGPRELFNKWPLLERLRKELSAALSREVFDAAWERGQALDLTETLAALAAHYHIEDHSIQLLDKHQPIQLPTSHSLVEPLSEREMEVLRLLKTELSGPEIARELMVSLNTVRFHTKNIYAKLEVNNRRSAVNRAIELGL